MTLTPMDEVWIDVRVNGEPVRRCVPARMLLIHFLREELRLTGHHVGCVSGRCGCCTVYLDDRPVKACLMLAVQVDGRSLTTVEGLSSSPDELHPVQEAFWACDAVECGFCTPGMIMSAYALLQRDPKPDTSAIAEALGGNLCRCTGYVNIVRAVEQARDVLASEGEVPR
jgi:carbon-monoxide dehydrogenase small subunit